MTTQTAQAIRVQGFEKSYKELRVLRGVDFDVARGSIFALLGSNGAGKTTVVNILSTLLKADAGTVQGCAAIFAVVGSVTDRLDQVVHCAVDAYATPILDADPERFARALTTNGASLLYLTQGALPFLPRGGTVFFLTSRGGRIVVANYAAIGVAKALAESMMRYLAVELAPRGIRINAIAPAIVETDAVRTLFGTEAANLVRHAADHNPSGRGVVASDYTNLMRWLASPQAEFIQGQVIFVNGGANLSA